jgi:hypothetical protein
LLYDCVGVTPIAAGTICASQDDQVVVSVEFPYQLTVAGHAEVSVVDMRGVCGRSYDPRGIVSVPINGIAEVALDKIEEAKAVLSNPIRPFQESAVPFSLVTWSGRRGPLTSLYIGDPKAGYELSPRGGQRTCETRVEPERESRTLYYVADNGTHSPGYLAQGHTAEAPHVPGYRLQAGLLSCPAVGGLETLLPLSGTTAAADRRRLSSVLARPFTC